MTVPQRARGPLVAVALASLAAGLGACGGESSQDSGAGVGAQLVAPINIADCRDWNRGSADERTATIGQIRDFVGQPVAGGAGSGVTLNDEEAYELFEAACADNYARGFKLYKLYSRAAAFSG